VIQSGKNINLYNRVEIDLTALRLNYRNIQKQVGTAVRIMAIVKSDAYGHGLVPVAKALSREGARTFGVAEIGEGIRLRQAGIEGEIAILLGTMIDSFPELVEYDLQPVVYDLNNLVALAAYAQQHGQQIAVHLKVDTGMGRLGIMPEQIDNFLEVFESSTGVRLAGISSHFPRADDCQDKTQAIEQNKRFAEILHEIRKGSEIDTVHIANSAAILNVSDSNYSMVRPGITLYGCYPFPEAKISSNLQLKPVMSLKTRVIQVKDVPAGYGISYGHTYTTKRPTRLAVLPIGYNDGYLRRLNGRAEVIIAGQRVPVLGRICMNACLADVTDLDQVMPGDEVVIMGSQGEAEITADEIAEWSDTISYEILCLFGVSNQRVYLPD
jgi:alanine racemase